MTNVLISKKTWFAVGAITLLLMSAVYIYQVNDLVQSVYLRDENNEKLTELQERIKRSKVVISQNQSLTQVDKMIEKKGYERVSQIDYIQVSDTQVAAIQ
ncbi:MAG: hypothetical protein V5A57_03265 [Candidatus Paceibacterota bacterium]